MGTQRQKRQNYVKNGLAELHVSVYITPEGYVRVNWGLPHILTGSYLIAFMFYEVRTKVAQCTDVLGVEHTTIGR